MKTLLVLRHAKSSWDDAGLKDHDRPLSPRGARDAPRMGRLLAERELVPDRILSSTAVRAVSTAELVAAACGTSPPIETLDSLYLAAPGDYLDAVRASAGDAERLMVVGHNPGLTTLVTVLTGACERMPTAALARIEFDVDRWTEVADGAPGRLVDLWRPEELDRPALDG